MQEQNSEKSVVLTVKAAKMTANILKSAVKHFLQEQKNKSPKMYKGKQSIRHLVQGSGNSALTNIEITDQNIKSFDRTARKFGIDYALKKDCSEEPPKYFIFFKAKDNEVMTAAFKDFLNSELNRNKNPSIRQKLKSLGEQVMTKTQELIRNKTKNREAER